VRNLAEDREVSEAEGTGVALLSKFYLDRIIISRPMV